MSTIRAGDYRGMTELKRRGNDRAGGTKLHRALPACAPIRVFAVLLAILSVIHPLAACMDNDAMSDSSNSGKYAGTTGETTVASPQPPVPVSSQNIPIYTYEVVNSWPHDPKAFTQGLAFYQGSLYESTGHYGSSTLRKVDLRKGEVTKKVDVSPQCFAEGMTIYQGKIYQLTWTEHKGFIYDLKSLRLESEFAYEGEGWGLTHDDHFLIMSDGTNQIRFLDPTSFKIVRTISITDNDQPLTNLNELEYVKGEIYANIWRSDRIVRIEPQTGRIIGWIDLSGLLQPAEHANPAEDVLNGIAYDDKDDRLFVTGKRWSKLFEIRVKNKETLQSATTPPKST